MRIGIDGRCLEWNRGGPARYLTQMLTRWPRLSSRHRYVLFFQRAIPGDDFLKDGSFERVLIPGPAFLKTRRILGEQILLPPAVRRSRLDLFFSPWYSVPLISFVPRTVIAVWDISYTTHPDHFTPAERFSFGYFSSRSSRRASGIITCSPFDARQIESYYGIPPERILTVQLAAGDDFSPGTDPERGRAFRRRRGLPERYLLSMGIIIKRRDVDVKIDAFREVMGEFPDAGLVVIGRNAVFPAVDIVGRMKDLIASGRGVYLERAADEDLADFYRNAWYYMCTSTVDGESLMLKEALKCGTPVIASPMLREAVDGNAVVIEDPTSRAGTAAVFRAVLRDAAAREERAAAGLAWARTLDWDTVARQSLAFLESR